MATLDGSIVNVALKTMNDQFGGSLSRVQWVVTAYLLIVSVTLMSMGRLGDLLGRLRVFVGGIVLFTIASFLCGVSNSLGTLVAARVLQGLGGSAMIALSPALVAELSPPAQLGRALGMLMSTIAAGQTVGPALGGIMLQHWSWHWVFFLNVPIGLVAAIYAGVTLPKAPARGRVPFDLVGVLTSSVALGALLAMLALFPEPESRATAYVLLGVAVVAGAGFLVWERKATSPLLNLSLFRTRVFSLGALGLFLCPAAVFANALLAPFYLTHVQGMSMSAMGRTLCAVPASVFLSSMLAGELSDRVGSWRLRVGGFVLLALGLGSIGVAGMSDATWSIVARFVVIGVGVGLVIVPTKRLLIALIPKARLGADVGLIETIQYLGPTFGVSIAGALFSLRAAPTSPPPVFLSGFALALMSGAALAVVGGVLAAAIVQPAAAPSK